MGPTDASLMADLALVTVVAATAGLVCRRLGQPSILGYLLAGLMVGPYLPIPLFADPHRVEELAEVGVVLVLFAVGLEFRVGRLLEILPASGGTALVQMGALAWSGYGVGRLLGWESLPSACLGATLAISSTMVVTAVFRGQKVDGDVRGHVLGVLVVQDVAAIVIMALVTAIATGRDMGLASVGLLLAELAGVILLLLVFGLLVVPRMVRAALADGDAEVLALLAAGSAFGFALLAGTLGYSAALGAFLAGVAVAESGRGHEIAKVLDPLRALFAAIFFASIGMTVDPLLAWDSLPLALALCAVVVGVQFLSVAAGTVLTGGSVRRGVTSGLALGQIGELSFVIATIAIGAGLLPDTTLPALVTVATVTAFTTPLLLARAPAIVVQVDHRMPKGLTMVLTRSQSFLRRLRRGRFADAVRGPLLAVLVDWLALVVLFVGHETLRPLVMEQAHIAVDLVALVFAVPFLIGLVRSASRLARGVRAILQADGPSTSRLQAVESVLLVSAVTVIGAPTVAVLAPVVDGVWVESLAASVFLGSLVLLGLRVSWLRTEASGARELATRFASHVAADDEADAHTEEVDGVDVEWVVVAVGSEADGRTLADLDLRVRTGATVVARVGRDGTRSFPTAHDPLHGEDRLAVSGDPDAVCRVCELFGGT